LFELKAQATKIVQQLQAAGFAAFWVGGCVRDFLLGREPQDFDIATDAKPEQVEKLFKRTVAVRTQIRRDGRRRDKHQFQVATFRAEADYQDGRRPEKVVFANAEAARCAAISRSTDFSTIRFQKKLTTGSAAKRICARKLFAHRQTGRTIWPKIIWRFAARGSICRAIGF